MNSKRSYLDTLNVGRQRRPYATLEELNRSLETLEQRLGRSRDETAGYREPRYGHARPYEDQYHEDHRRPTMPRREEPRAYQQQPRRTDGSLERNYQAIARDIDRMRGQEDGLSAAGKIAGELRSLREELRQQMTVGVVNLMDEGPAKDAIRRYLSCSGNFRPQVHRR